MKTFIVALIIFALLCGAIFGVSSFVLGRISELSGLALALAEDEAEFFPPSERLLSGTEEFFALWDKSMRVFPYIMGYEMLDRADEAALSLRSYAKSGERAEFLAAKMRFLDSVERLRELFSVRFESIA
ncbi:MAG: hypothetical protein IJX55_10130 [Clostridia bacterium]|nr:hypothetical protein [Clostridia bacterium]